MEISPKICPNCGTEINEHENFCMNCGWTTEEKKHLRPKMRKEELDFGMLLVLCICTTPCGALIYYLLTRGE